MSSYCRSFATLSAHQKSTVGDTKTSVIDNDHLGWLRCDGRSLAISEFYLLYRVIGNSFGAGTDTTFVLPKAAGTVPGIVGSGTDDNSIVSTFTLGRQICEYAHRLTIGELATHNHGVAPGGQIGTNSNTTSNATGITTQAHSHQYTTTNDNNQLVTNTGLGDTHVNDGTVGATTDATTVLITDPTHFHSINPAGSNFYHNNIQPTLPIGNMFIYSGRPTYPTQLTNGTSGVNGWPYTINTRIY